MNNPERSSQRTERKAEVLAPTPDIKEVASSESRTHSPERHADTLEKARRDANEIAVSTEKPANETGRNAADGHIVRPVNSGAARNRAYKDILHHTQLELEPVARTFSKIVHQPIVEKTSAAIGATVARPNAILFGSLFALVISGGLYFIARHYGYSLSGFEAIGSFAIGWIIGLLVDVVRVALRR